jgi:hypothetical protein
MRGAKPMFKITVIGIDKVLLTAVESMGKIEYIDQCRQVFTASFDGCTVKVKGERVRIKNPKKHTVLYLFDFHQFEEISIT